MDFHLDSDNEEVMAKAIKRENPFLNLIINIALPVAILNKAEKWDHPQAPLIALAAALALPLGYGLWDYLKNNRKNMVAALGIINVSFTGGFALMSLSGIWFAIKEAFFPFLLGVGVLLSQYLNKPYFVSLLKNSGAFSWELIEEKAQSLGTLTSLKAILRNTNLLFASSFFISSLLNFILAISIFKPIDEMLNEAQKQQILNQQIAEMTWKGYVVIAFPLMFFMGFIMWYFIRGVKKHTGLQFEDFAGESDTRVSS